MKEQAPIFYNSVPFNTLNILNLEYLVKQLTKVPSMVVAWRVQREPCRPNHNTSFLRAFQHYIIENQLFNTQIIMARSGKSTQTLY